MKPSHRHRALFALVLAALALASSAKAEVTDEEYAVYEALLQQIDWKLPKAGPEYVVERYVIRDTTSAEGTSAKSIRDLQKLDRAALAMFEERNRTHDRLVTHRFPNVTVWLVTGVEYNDIFLHPGKGGATVSDGRFTEKADSWSYFEGMHPRAQGLLTVSKVGFGEDGRQALLYFRDQLQGTRGNGCFARLEKTPEGWKVRQVDRMGCPIR